MGVGAGVCIIGGGVEGADGVGVVGLPVQLTTITTTTTKRPSTRKRVLECINAAYLSSRTRIPFYFPDYNPPFALSVKW